MQTNQDAVPQNPVFANLRKSTLRLFLVFLSLTAGIAMVTVLVGDFGDFEFKILVTTLTISAFSICAMSSFAYLQRGGDTTLASLALVVKSLTAILLIVATWFEIDNLTMLKLLGVMSTASVAFTHAFLLTLVRLEERQRWVQFLGIALLWLLAALIASALVLEVQEEGFYRLLVVVAIAVTLFTLVIPILGRMRKASSTPSSSRLVAVVPSQRLILDLGEDGGYRDADGVRYVVRRADGLDGDVAEGSQNPYG
tara:strand:- start:12141 stop:12902 length:762 start_codon:yes stop_codon:yes gene_type:complete